MKKRYLGLLIIIGIGFGVTTFINKKTYLSEDDVIGVYINNELYTDIPSKDSAIFQKAICDDENVSATWDSESWGLLLKNLTKKTKCNLYFYQGDTVFNFDYTGGEQTFIAPVSGTYKLETWGAQGGGHVSVGGYGGYSLGNIFFSKESNLFINVGGQGASSSSENQLGGYNGGGSGSVQNNYENLRYFSSGGGATHIATKSGLLVALEDSKNTILEVSGGGGGAFYSTEGDNLNGGAGGGFFGSSGAQAKEGWGTYGKGGTQSAGGYSICDEITCKLDYATNEHDAVGFFGSGGSRGIFSSGGGAGWYGGGGSHHIQSAGGGSGYIGNPLLTNKAMYCYNCEESNEESTKTISTTCAEETPTENCAKKGNGYARITLVSIDE